MQDNTSLIEGTCRHGGYFSNLIPKVDKRIIAGDMEFNDILSGIRQEVTEVIASLLQETYPLTIKGKQIAQIQLTVNSSQIACAIHYNKHNYYADLNKTARNKYGQYNFSEYEGEDIEVDKVNYISPEDYFDFDNLQEEEETKNKDKKSVMWNFFISIPVRASFVNPGKVFEIYYKKLLRMALEKFLEMAGDDEKKKAEIKRKFDTVYYAAYNAFGGKFSLVSYKINVNIRNDEYANCFMLTNANKVTKADLVSLESLLGRIFPSEKVDLGDGTIISLNGLAPYFYQSLKNFSNDLFTKLTSL